MNQCFIESFKNRNVKWGYHQGFTYDQKEKLLTTEIKEANKTILSKP